MWVTQRKAKKPISQNRARHPETAPRDEMDRRARAAQRDKTLVQAGMLLLQYYQYCVCVWIRLDRLALTRSLVSTIHPLDLPLASLPPVPHFHLCRTSGWTSSSSISFAGMFLCLPRLIHSTITALYCTVVWWVGGCVLRRCPTTPGQPQRRATAGSASWPPNWPPPDAEKWQRATPFMGFIENTTH